MINARELKVARKEAGITVLDRVCRAASQGWFTGTIVRRLLLYVEIVVRLQPGSRAFN